jgi:hypothetical protein
VTLGAWNDAAAAAAAAVAATVAALDMEYEARMRSDEMAMRFSCRQHAMQMRRLDSRWWQKWVASGTEDAECDADEAAEASEAIMSVALALVPSLLLLLPPLLEPLPLVRVLAADAPL